jgi:hypothetical protein
LPGLSLSGTTGATFGGRDGEGARTSPTQKINLRKEENFPASKSTAKITTFYQQLTTHLPSRNHVLHPVFRKTPSNNAVFPTTKKSKAKISLWRESMGSG